MDHIYVVVETEIEYVTYLPDTPTVTNLRAFMNRGPAHEYMEKRQATLDARSYNGAALHIDLISLDESPEVR